MRYIILALTLVMVGCTTTPIQGVVEGGLLGNGEKNILNQMRHIAYHAAVVRDPGMTDAEFEEWVKDKTEDEFKEWVARTEYEQKRMRSLFSLYAVLRGTDTTDYSGLHGLGRAMKKSHEDLAIAQEIYYNE